MENKIRDIIIFSVDFLSKINSYQSYISLEMPQQRQQTQRFDLKLQVPAFLAQENVCMVFSSILDEAQTRLAIYELKQSSFSYDVPGEGNFAEISRYLHSSEKITVLQPLSKLGYSTEELLERYAALPLNLAKEETGSSKLTSRPSFCAATAKMTGSTQAQTLSTGAGGPPRCPHRWQTGEPSTSCPGQ